MSTKITLIGDNDFHWGIRTYIMGIVNVSPDSFSGDGVISMESAVEQAQKMEQEGADILDIGGESTRPNALPVLHEEELKRVIPALEKICRKVKIPVSIDTTKYDVAVRALDAGAAMLNDQWGLKKEPRLAALAATRHVPIILMSNQRDSGGFDAQAGRDTGTITDIMSEIKTCLRSSIETAKQAGIPEENIIIDPGIGFGKTWQQELEIIRRLNELKGFGQPILLGTSRKSLIKMVLNLPANDRVEGTAATVAIGIANGANIVRVHDVKQMVRVCKMSDAIVRRL
jgi:dihydropteroate synthase